MSVDVTFEAVRKSDFVPFASMYLGGNGTARTIYNSRKSYQEVSTGADVVTLGDWKDAIDYLIEIEDSFYLGHEGNDAIELINQCQDQMAYFLRVG